MLQGSEGGTGRSRANKTEWTLQDEEARRYIGSATGGIVSLVESTFGPWGMEKLIETEDLQGRPEVVRTGNTNQVFDAIERGGGFSHPVSAMFVDTVDGMQRGLADGTTSLIVLAGALLKEGFNLVDRGLEPGNVVVGYGMARARAGEVLDDLSRPVDINDRETLSRIASTTMAGDIECKARERYARYIATAVSELAAAGDNEWVNTDDVKVLASVSVNDELQRGLILSQPDNADPTGRGIEETLTEVTVAVIDDEIDFEETASVLDGGEGVRVRTAEAATTYRTGLKQRIERTATNLVEMGVDVLICQEKVDPAIVGPVEQAGVAVVDKAKYPKEDIYRLSRAADATTVTNLQDLSVDHLGHVRSVRYHQLGDEMWTVFEDCPGAVYTLVVGGNTEEDVERRRTAVEDALETTAVAAVDKQVLPGAGAPAMAVAATLRKSAPQIEGREQLAFEAFANALDRLPFLLARNAGLDPIETVTRLQSMHADSESPSSTGLDLETGGNLDSWEAGIIEPRRVFSQAIETAGSIVERLLTIDTVLYPNVQLPGYVPCPESK